MNTKFLQSEEGDLLNMGGNQYFFKQKGSEDPNGMCIMEAVIAPYASPPLHVHQEVDEVVMPIDGTLTVKIGEQVQEVQAGGVALMPKGIVHSFINLNDHPVKAYGFFLSGNIDGYFFDMAEELKDLPPGPPPQELVAKLGEKYDFQVVGPPLTKELLTQQS